MGQCDFWLSTGRDENCELTNRQCNCGGSEEHCSIKGRGISDVFKQEETTLKSASLQARKRRHMREAS